MPERTAALELYLQLGKESLSHELGSNSRRVDSTQGFGQAGVGQLTDNDLDVIAGSKDKLVGMIQERYGIKKDEALKQFDNWSRTLVSSAGTREHSSR